MIDNHVYTDYEIQDLCSTINRAVYIGINDDYSAERFKQIKIHDTYIPYIISSFGRIFSINYSNKYHNIRKLKTKIEKTGYERIVIKYNKYYLSLSIHRLVAMAFIKNDDATKIEVNHKNGHKSCNHVDNLEWVTPKENIQHAFIKDLRKVGNDHPRSKYNSDQIEKVCSMIMENYKIQDIINVTKVPKSTIFDVLYGKAWLSISSKYSFDNYHFGVTENDFQNHLLNIHKVCILLEENQPIKYIKKVTHLSDNVIYKILHKRIHTNISDKYDFSKYNHGKFLKI